jgi:hypothetical protein
LIGCPGFRCASPGLLAYYSLTRLVALEAYHERFEA